MIFALAFLGGLLLNLMPCVLPTLALKVGSPASDRGPFAAGMLTVFAILATLAATAGFAWGQHLQSQPFIIGLTTVTFVSGLAYLGVWHFPTFGARDQSSAFAKGVLATLLGTGCSGPFLGTVFASSLQQPPITIFSLFMLIGLGMTTPYLILPYLRLPKPGAWMETFQEVAGFAMIGTSIWLLTGVADKWLFPTIILLLAAAFACRFPRLVWVLILAIAPFGMVREALPWQPFDPVRMQTEQVVLVEFSAPLCLTCDMNKAILNSAAIRRTVERLNVLPLDADVANNPAAAELLAKLGYDSVPVLAIFRGDRPPVVMPDLISASTVLAELESAAQSR